MPLGMLDFVTPIHAGFQMANEAGLADLRREQAQQAMEIQAAEAEHTAEGWKQAAKARDVFNTTYKQLGDDHPDWDSSRKLREAMGAVVPHLPGGEFGNAAMNLIKNDTLQHYHEDAVAARLEAIKERERAAERMAQSRENVAKTQADWQKGRNDIRLQLGQDSNDIKRQIEEDKAGHYGRRLDIMQQNADTAANRSTRATQKMEVMLPNGSKVAGTPTELIDHENLAVRNAARKALGLDVEGPAKPSFWQNLFGKKTTEEAPKPKAFKWDDKAGLVPNE